MVKESGTSSKTRMNGWTLKESTVCINPYPNGYIIYQDLYTIDILFIYLLLNLKNK